MLFDQGFEHPPMEMAPEPQEKETAPGLSAEQEEQVAAFLEPRLESPETGWMALAAAAYEQGDWDALAERMQKAGGPPNISAENLRTMFGESGLLKDAAERLKEDSMDKAA